MSSLYQLRITCSKEQDEKTFTWIRKNADLYFIVDETANCRHLQGLIESSKTMRALRESFRRDFPELLGNKAYSLTQWEPDAEHLHPAQYFLKGSKGKEPIILLNTMIPEADLPSIIEAAKAHAIKLQKIGKGCPLTSLLEWAKTQEGEITDQDIYKQACVLVRAKNQAIRPNTILTWVETVQFDRGYVREIVQVKRRKI